ncbi:MAG: lysoplasmalogenase [Acidimicrobiia bacterium]|nr:lysoplasmalogenase [Acidimicrobiia bacterium]
MIVTTVLGAAFVVALVWAERFRPGLRPGTKLAASAAFVAVAIQAGALDTSYGRWVLAALLLSAIGDAALLSDSTKAFLIGLGSFLVAHLAYVGAFAVRGMDSLVFLFALAALLVVAGLVVRWLWPSVESRLRIPVVVYAVVITAMVAAALATAAAESTVAIPVAAMAFYLSDLAVARERFVRSGFINKAWGLPLYFAAQYLFAWTV